MCKKLKLLDSKSDIVTPFHSEIKGNETYASAMTYETPLMNAQMYVTAHLLVWHFCHFTWRRKGQVIILQLPIQFHSIRMSAIITTDCSSFM